MTVQDLINKLQMIDPSLNIYIDCGSLHGRKEPNNIQTPTNHGDPVLIKVNL